MTTKKYRVEAQITYLALFSMHGLAKRLLVGLDVKESWVQVFVIETNKLSPKT